MTDGTAQDPRGSRPAGVSAFLALVLSTVGFFALLVFGLGGLSLATDTDIIAVPGLGQAPGAIGVIVAVGVFTTGSWRMLRPEHPSYRPVWLVALTTALAHLVAVWLVIVITSGEAVTATVVAGDLVRGGAGLVLLAAAAVAAWCGVALRRTRARAPRWPWEDDEE